MTKTLLLSSLTNYLPRMSFPVFYFINSVVSSNVKVALRQQLKDLKIVKQKAFCWSSSLSVIPSCLFHSLPLHLLISSLSLSPSVFISFTIFPVMLPVFQPCILSVWFMLMMHLCACCNVLCVSLP